VIDNGRKDDPQALAESLVGEPPAAPREGEGSGPCGAAVEPGIAGRTAWTLRVQTGCDEPCSYCIIPATRGRPRSRRPEGVLAELERVVAGGFKEVALAGVHLGAWGRDLHPPMGLADLLRAVAGRDLPVRVRVSSLEPMECGEAVIDLLASDARFAPHLHLPLQHASDRVLAAMRRPYTLDAYRRLVDRVRSGCPTRRLAPT